MNTVANVKTESHGDILSMSGGGLKDITRIASSDPVMWRDICLKNKRPVVKLIDQFQDTLENIKTLIEQDQADALQETFANANVSPGQAGGNQYMIIAIDGPAGSGKSTVAQLIASRLNFKYIETGSMYRAVAWKANRRESTRKTRSGSPKWPGLFPSSFNREPSAKR